MTTLGDRAVEGFGESEQHAGDYFQATFGSAPVHVWAAPGRVNIIGEHTDYNNGFALPIAIPMHTTAALTPRTDSSVRVSSRQRPGEIVDLTAALRPGGAQGWAGYVAGVIWSLAEAGVELPGGMDIAIDGQVPEGSGLSSSAALECAVASAVVEASGATIELSELARLAQRAENDYVGAPTGVMDQTASLRCLERHALLLDAATLQVRQVPFDLRGEGLALLIINTNAPHSHADGEYAARRESCEYAARTLGVSSLRELTDADLAGPAVAGLDEVTRRRVTHVVTENARVLRTVELLDDGLVREIGPLLSASHASLRDDYEISIPQLDTAVDAALDAGAYGARLTGGGFGGCAIALADAEQVGAIRTAVEQAYAARDFAAPEFYVAVPSDGARPR